MHNFSLDSDVEAELEQALASENTQWASNNFGESTATPELDNFVTRQIILLQEEREMRSSEVHYIDHPVLNVIIQITPYSAELSTPTVQ